jgi:hypothetical protein
LGFLILGSRNKATGEGKNEEVGVQKATGCGQWEMWAERLRYAVKPAKSGQSKK